MENLRYIGHQFFQLLPEPLNEISQKLAPEKPIKHSGCLEHDDIYSVVNAGVSRFLDFPYCAHSECPESTETATSDSSFGLCAGCKVMRYCSKDCQKTAWKHPELAHGEICKDLGRFMEMRNGLMKRGLFKKHLTTKIVKKAGYQKRFTEETLLHLHRYLKALGKAEDEYQAGNNAKV
ncbi:hypothetical protein C8J56DRAFT_861685 [Mycena floridula]|nr:hypothetical protein C8J56DRAFT_861685 [Mycena floridula]